MLVISGIEKQIPRHHEFARCRVMYFDASPMPRSAQLDIPADVFEAGSLYLFKDVVEMRLTATPVPRAVRRQGAGQAWVPFIPEFRVVHPYRPRRAPVKKSENPDQLAFDFFGETFTPESPVRETPAQRRRRAFDQFRFSMPKAFAKVIEPFKTHQWPLLVLLSHDELALELASSNPALAFFLAQKIGGDVPMIQALRCCSMRQRDLMDVLDLPNTNGAVKLFRKIEPASLNGDNWPSMLEIFSRELSNIKSPLNHLEAINSGVIEILSNPAAARAVAPSLLEEVARDKAENHRGRIIHMITGTLQMQEELRDDGSSHAKRTHFTSLSRLKETHEEVTKRYRRRIRQLIEANQHDTEHFRRPPLPGIPGKIEPITSPEGLVNEGEEQGNCVASYAERVRQGSTFIYRVLQPERATLSLVKRSPFSDWQIGELESKYNTDVQGETEDFVEAWLVRHQSMI
ncbi:MAG: PcfJ domain-containing protein [Verrucomicrobiales bacterium]|nr:PcfJ domain-containing protein [Verrucomicrobiales bacterium]